MEDSDKLWDCLCCAGEDHTLREGGTHVNLVILRKLAKWPYLSAKNFLVPESEKYPLAMAVVCDRCMSEKREIKYALVGRQGGNGTEYYRVPVSELEEPEVYWPELHPDQQPIVGG